jgi:hypothetical protein
MGLLTSRDQGKSQSRRAGFVVVAVTLSAVFLLGMAGLAVDLGRMYVTNNEAQTLADSAAIDAALQLDGTAAGLIRASNIALSNPKRWQFGTTAFGGIDATFSSSLNGTYKHAADAEATSTYARVSARADVPLYFLPVVVSSNNSRVSAAAIAGRLPKTEFSDGFFPFSPISHKNLDGSYRQVCNLNNKGVNVCISPGGAGDPNDPDDRFGMKKGTLYTLRSGNNGEKTGCVGDDNDTMNQQRIADDPSDRGYVSGHPGTTSNRDIGDAILDGMNSDPPVKIGEPTESVPGARNNNPGNIADRVLQDTDPSSVTYDEYVRNRTGNGRRIIVSPINSGDASGHIVVGFAAFFLLRTNEYHHLNGNQSACAEYIGPWIEGSPFPGGSPSGSYVVRLLK